METDTTAIMAEDMVKIIYFIRSKQLNRQYTGRPYGYGGGYGGYGGYGGPSISVYPGWDDEPFIMNAVSLIVNRIDSSRFVLDLAALDFLVDYERG